MRGLREDMFQLRGSRREMTADGSGREAADGGAAAPGPPGSLRRYFHVPSPRPPPSHLGCVASPSSRRSILRDYDPS